MMRRTLCLFLVACSTLMGAVDTKEYSVRLRIQPDGSAQGRIQLSLKDAVPGSFELPFGIPQTRDLQVVAGPKGTGAVLLAVDGQPRIRLTLPESVSSETVVSLAFTASQVFSTLETGKGQGGPAIRLLKHAFVNTREGVIGEYRFEALLPEATMAQAIREQLPKPSKKEFEPRVRLGRIEGRASATLCFGPMHQGDDTSMNLEITSTRRSWGWLLAGVALALLYLIRFRDLITPPAPESRLPESPQS